jgi:hypothetical protein
MPVVAKVALQLARTIEANGREVNCWGGTAGSL